MKLVATIDGIGVYSDKQVNQISNTRIGFTDGSWCDVATNKVVNSGPGSISLGSPETGRSTSKKPKKIGPEFFTGRAVDISGITANVDITVGDKLSITIEGPEAEVDTIKFTQLGDRLVVEGSNAGSKGGLSGINVSSGHGGIFVGGAIRGSHVMVSSGNVNVVSMSGGGGSSSTKVSITVPKGAEVNAQDIDGKTTIGDTEGPVQASVRGDDDFTIGKIGDATLSIQGGGDITVANVNGNLNINLQGSGDVRVKNGNVPSLSVNLMGSGDVKFGGRAKNASLSVMGSGDIDVAHVTNRPSIRTMGSGDVTVSNW